ncbi:MAG: hypothetical protein CL866_03755 [Cycloclasticus sp.]|nr:hypothetical protein [Cycloclasticus sp.]MBG95970.1 hypothetical protein [Cycloclasticus sp.]HAI97341.1 hypothetical protein [Methylococcaceae bacterium]|tara:strand:- start:441 stop:737 length:297 start_codon:yes stop_codon:yes gene_type:complete
MSEMKEMACSIYKTKKRDGLYLYVKEQDDFSEVPAEVMQQFTALEHVFDLTLSLERPLARAEVSEVIKSLATQGFYIQMPPQHEDPIDTIQLPDSLHG